MIVASIILSGLLHATCAPEPFTVEGYDNAYPVSVEVMPIGGTDKHGMALVLRTDAAAAFMAMRRAMTSGGVDLRINYAHRSLRQQYILFKKSRKNAGVPGVSVHHQGTAIDVGNCSIKKNGRRRDTETCRWLKQRAADFGFRQTIAREPWHWEYIGTADYKETGPTTTAQNLHTAN
jgi:LAS superfamily LD-carboxypeptidase LdcB